MSGVRMLQLSREWWKFIQIHQYYTIALKSREGKKKFTCSNKCWRRFSLTWSHYVASLTSYSKLAGTIPGHITSSAQVISLRVITLFQLQLDLGYPATSYPDISVIRLRSWPISHKKRNGLFSVSLRCRSAIFFHISKSSTPAEENDTKMV